MTSESYSPSQQLSPVPSLHVPSSTFDDGNKNPRPRAIRACQACRSRRVRCDNGKPKCSACIKAGLECIQVLREDAVAIDLGTQKILQRLDDIENTLNSLRLPVSSPVATASATPNTSRLTVTTEELLSWTVFRGWFDDSRGLKALLQTSTNSGTSTTTPPVWSALPPISGELDTTYTRHFVDQFFRHVHVKNPMLEEANIRQIVHLLSSHGPTWELRSCLALLICALGSLASNFDPFDAPRSSSRSMTGANMYFSAAQQLIGMTSGANGVVEAQCHFYSGVYYMTTIQPLRAWQCFVQALACCQAFACANASYQRSSAQRLRRSLPVEECVYWSCWKSERELRVYLDLPDFAVGNLSYPILFPTPPEDMADLQTASWYFYLSEISLRRLDLRCREEIGNILRKGGESLVNDLLESTQTLEELAAQWEETLPPVMSLHTAQENDDVLKFILRGHLLDLFEVIYWPWLELSLNKGVSYVLGTVYGQKALQTGIDRIRINKPGFHHRHHGTWLMLQSCSRSALMLIAAKTDAKASTMLPHNWENAVYDVVELLRFWQYDSPDIADRLRILERLVGNISN